MTNSTPVVAVDVDGEIMVITIERPHVRNALSPAVTDAICEAFALLDASPDVRIAILTGAGGYFSAGMDLAQYSEGSGFSIDLLRELRPRKPLIAAIEGFAFAGGLELALACDMLVASSTAVLGIPEVKRGIFAPGGALFRLPQRIPFHVAMEMALTGDSITAERAAQVGLVNSLCEPGDALATAFALARRVLANGPRALEVTKELIMTAADHHEKPGWDRQAEVLDYVFGSEDAAEGPRAFLEKRAPQWSGR